MAIIGLSGKIGSGKDLAGIYLQHILGNVDLYSTEYWEEQTLATRQMQSGWQIKKYGDALKEIVCILTGCHRADLENQEFKNKPLSQDWALIRETTTDSVNIYPTDYNGILPATATHEVLTPRVMLQLLGTECGRRIIHPNIWVNALMKDYKPEVLGEDIYRGERYTVYDEYPKWLITDVRFPNEVAAIEKRGGIVVRIERDVPHNTHESETALDNHRFDYVVENNGTKKQLYSSLEKVVKNFPKNLVK